ncbi:MAG: beta-lactamase [Limisphaerales bacterium]|nr:MAG: beta-lactamase [Limisphaerales bacterium]TXT46785.1 MAG: beta-lactamase [Limisphaerales bacterium]
MQADSSRNFLWLALKVGGGVLLLLMLLLGGLLTYVTMEKRKYDRLTDTHDLRQRATRMGEGYVADRQDAALVIGLTQRGRRAVLGLGRVSATNAVPPDGRTLFEIGSVTKVFTALALARLDLDGKVKLADTLRASLPEPVALAGALEPVTLLHLATHTSGLPRLPGNLDTSAANLANPYAKYDAAQLYQFLGGAKPNNPPGRLMDYSNVGFAVLGHVLALKAERPYEDLVRSALLEPLGMTNTAIRLTEEQRARLTRGHSPKGGEVSGWDFDVFAPTGAFRSNAGDMLAFIEANLADAETPVGRSLTHARQLRKVGDAGDLPLGWQREVTLQGGLEVFWHNGGTGGHVSFIAFSRTQQVGVVVLSNYGDAMAGKFEVDRIGMELLKLGSKVSLE